MEVEAILGSTRLSTFQNIMFDSRDFILVKVEIFSTFDLTSTFATLVRLLRL